MDKNQRIKYAKYALIGLLYLAAFVDLYTTFSHKNFYILESNPFIKVAFWAVLAVKLLYPVVITYYVFREKTREITRYFYLSVAIMLVIVQLYAGYNNFTIKSHIYDEIVTKNPQLAGQPMENIPSAEIAKYKLEDNKAAERYFNDMFMLIVYPLLLANLTFGAYRFVFLKD